MASYRQPAMATNEQILLSANNRIFALKGCVALARCGGHKPGPAVWGGEAGEPVLAVGERGLFLTRGASYRVHAVGHVRGHRPVRKAGRIATRGCAALDGVADHTRWLLAVRDSPRDTMRPKLEAYTSIAGPGEDAVAVAIAVAGPQVGGRIDKGAPAGHEHRIVERDHSHAVTMNERCDNVRRPIGMRLSLRPRIGRTLL